MTHYFEDTAKANISTIKPTKCGKIMKFKPPSKGSPAYSYDRADK